VTATLDDAAPTPLAGAQLDSEDLTLLASQARTAIGCDAMLITGRDSRDRTTIVGSAGLDADDLRTLWPLVVEADRADDETAAPGAGVPMVAPLPGIALASGHEVRRIAMFIAGKRMGAFHLVVDPDAACDEAAASDFARHAAVAIARRRLRRGSSAHLERRIARADAILDFAAAVSNVGFDSLIGRIEAAVRSVFGPVRTRAYMYNADSEALEALPHPGGGGSGQAFEPIRADDMRIAIARVFALGRSYMTNGPVEDDPPERAPTWTPKASALLTVPLFVSGRASGVLQIADKPGGFAMTDLHDAELLSRPIAVAVELTATLRRLRIQSEIEAVLSSTTALLRPATGVGAKLPQVIAAMREATAATVVMFASLHAPLLVARSGPTPASQEDFVGWLTSQLEHDALGLDSGVGCRALLIAPVRIGPQRVATLAAIAAPDSVFGSIEERGMARLANVVALSLAAERDLAQRTALARLEERQRVADELHDEVAQLLFAAQLQLDELIDLPGVGERVIDHAVAANSLLLRSDATLRRVITELPRRSSALFGDRLEAVVEETRRTFGAEIASHVSAAAIDAAAELGQEKQDILVSAARESVVNAAKHAGPCTITLGLHVAGTDTLRLSVTDNGIGLVDQAAAAGRPGHGLSALRRHVAVAGGVVEVTAGQTAGTSVVVRMPLRSPEAAVAPDAALDAEPAGL
jgi:signal transduction histidine kinase